MHMRLLNIYLNISAVFPVLLCGLILYSTGSYPATAFKCTQRGVTVFSDKPCDGAKSEEVYINDSFTNGESLRPDELKMLKEIEEKEKQTANESAQQPVPREAVKNKAAQNQAKPVIDKNACKKATEDLKQWQKVMSLGYPPEESENYIQEYRKKADTQKTSCGL